MIDAYTFNINMARVGHSVIVKLTGQKTSSMLQRNNTIDVDDARVHIAGWMSWISFYVRSRTRIQPWRKRSHLVPRRKRLRNLNL